MQFRAAGRYQDAESVCRQILEMRPNDPKALHVLALAIWPLGKRQAAAEAIQTAAYADPRSWELSTTLGIMLGALGRHEQAIAALRQAITIRPNSAESHFNLGNALNSAGKVPDALAAFRQALVIQENFVPAYINMATILRGLGRVHEAVAALRRAVQIQADSADAWYNLGNALRAIGKWDEAIAAYRKSAELRPNFASTWLNLGTTFLNIGAMDDALAAVQRAVSLDPANAGAVITYGIALRAKGRDEEALQYLRQGVQLDPNSVDALFHFAGVLRSRGNYHEALPAYRRVLQLRPDYAAAFLSLSGALQDLGRIRESLDCCQNYLVLQPREIDVFSHRLFLLHMHPDYEPHKIFEQHQEWFHTHAQPFSEKIPAHANDRDPDRPLRVGYVSADFRLHSVTFFLENFLANHDPKAVRVYCYSNAPFTDAITERIKKSAHEWRDIGGMSDERIAEKIIEDQIDILVDLAGHTGDNRLLVFARKPAPIQVTYLGYPDTTGLSTMNYRLTDAHADPVGMTESLHSEELFRLPRTFACYRPPEVAPEPNPNLPASQNGYVTFASFSTLAKVNPPLVETWAEILGKVPNSRLMMVAKGLGDPSVCQTYRDIAHKHGIAADRLIFRDVLPLADYLKAHTEVDIALDTSPVNGHTITCHALWMGVPVITLAGIAHYQRLGASVLANLNLSELVAQSPQQYVQIAVDLAQNLPRLNDLHAGLRQRMRESPLMDAAAFARDVEAAYRQMWRRWIQS
jgi:predicted O-linked N-acetylglucosamine transferase (SPINDLY family)